MALLLLLVLFFTPAVATAEPDTTLSVTVDGATLSVQAVDVPLDEVLAKIGDTIDARIVIETRLADELSRARVDTTLTRVPVLTALRRLLSGRQYAVLSGPNGVDEVRIYVDGKTGYRELTAADPRTRSRPASTPLAESPADDPAEVARLRQTVLGGPDAATRAEALLDLSGIRDGKLFIATLTQVLARERDSKVLEALFEAAAQHEERIPPDALRAFARSDRDGTPRAQAVDLLADQTGDQPATRALLRSLAASDRSPEVREAATTALSILEGPSARPASEVSSDRTRSIEGSPASR